MRSAVLPPLHPDSALCNVFLHLPVQYFALRYRGSEVGPACATDTAGECSIELLGTDEQPWEHLKSFCLVDTFWHDEVLYRPDIPGPTSHSDWFARIAFANWKMSVLIFDGSRGPWRDATDQSSLNFFDLFFNPVEAEGSDVWWTELERIELRIPLSMAADFRSRYDEAIKAGPLARLQRRILPMVVFIAPDGTESKLIDDAEST